jgi:hypothetical protein
VLGQFLGNFQKFLGKFADYGFEGNFGLAGKGG